MASIDIGIVGGTGRMGRALAVRWARAGHRVRIGSRDAERATSKAEALSQDNGVRVGGGSNADIVKGADMVVLSVPYAVHGDTIRELADGLRGKLVLDMTVPLAPPKVRRVSLPPGGAAGLEAQALLGDETAVVSALHHVSSAHLAAEHVPDCDVLVCGDRREARDRVIGLLEQLGMQAIDAGVMANAVALESLTPVLLHINKRYGVRGAGLRITGLAPETR